MESTANDTLDRIQREIQEALEREEELRQKYNLLNNNNNDVDVDEPPPKGRTNGFKTPSPEPPRTPTPTGAAARIFQPNPSSKGVMQKFLRMRGKLSIAALQTRAETQTAASVWTPDDAFEPAKVTLEAAGRPLRNGFVPAEEKMRRELQEFQKREAELRLERKKSQPDLMAALEREQEVDTNLRPARSTALLYSSEDLTDDSAPPSLKPARSLAELCDASDEELATPGTYSLIMQFENLKSQS